MLKIRKPFSHAGVMLNYQCTAACRHCLYACSPTYDDGYMHSNTMDNVIALLQESGCTSIHVGGGEPFINLQELCNFLKKAATAGLPVDYIETNACWATDEATIAQYFDALHKVGDFALCISLDPFHAEYIPHAFPLRLANACRKYGIDHFLWQQKFANTLRNVDPDTAHSRKELEALISPNYVLDTANAYGIRMSGRAIQIELEHSPQQPLRTLLSASGCNGLISTSHFHVDMHGRFVPPGCTGLSIPMEEAVRGIPAGKYPVYEALFSGGVAALYELAADNGFAAKETYTSSCALCFFIRKFLSEQGKFEELDGKYYEESLLY